MVPVILGWQVFAQHSWSISEASFWYDFLCSPHEHCAPGPHTVSGIELLLLSLVLWAFSFFYQSDLPPIFSLGRIQPTFHCLAKIQPPQFLAGPRWNSEFLQCFLEFDMMYWAIYLIPGCHFSWVCVPENRDNYKIYLLCQLHCMGGPWR